MEQTIINDIIPVSELPSNVDGDIEFIDPIRINESEEAHRKFVLAQEKAAQFMKSAGNNGARKKMIMASLKDIYPDLSLREFCDMYVKKSNIDSIEDEQNMDIADTIESDHFRRRGIFKKVRSRVAKARTKVLRKGKKIARKGVSRAARVRTKVLRKGKKIARKGVSRAARLRTIALRKSQAAARKGVSRAARLRTIALRKSQAAARKAISTAARTRTQALRKAKQVSGEIKKRVAGATILLPLQPLRPVMLAGLRMKKKKMKVTAPLIDIATAFYKHVVKGQNYETLENDWYEDDEMFHQPIENFDEDHIAVSAIAGIVTTIITFIKKAVKKKKEKQKATAAEQAIANETEKVLSKIEQKTGIISAVGKAKTAAQAEIATQQEIETENNSKYFIYGGLALLAFIAFKK